MSLQKQLWGEIDPYEYVREDFPALELNGFQVSCPHLKKEIERINPKRILEIGTHRAASLCWMAECAPDAELVSCDTWAYNADLFFNDRRRKRYALAHDYAIACIKSRGLGDRVTYLPMSSDEAFRLFEMHGITFDFAYIDGGHSYRQCKADLINTDAILDGDTIVVDDYEAGRFDGVVTAVDEFAEENGYQVTKKDRKAVLNYGGTD